MASLGVRGFFSIIFYVIASLWAGQAQAGVVCEERFPRLGVIEPIVPGERVVLSLHGKHLSECFPGHKLEWLDPWEGARLEHQPADARRLEQWILRWEAPADLAPQLLSIQVAVSWKGQREVQTIPIAVLRCEDLDFEVSSYKKTLYEGELGSDHIFIELRRDFPQLACRGRLALTVLEAPPGFALKGLDAWEWTPERAGRYLVRYEVALGPKVKRAELWLDVQPPPKETVRRSPTSPPKDVPLNLDLFGLRAGALLGGGAWVGPGLEVLFEGDYVRGGFLYDLARFYGFVDALLALGDSGDAGSLVSGGVGLQVGVGFVTLGVEVSAASLDEALFLSVVPAYHLYSLVWRGWAFGASVGYTFSAGDPADVAGGPVFRLAFVPLE